MRTDDNPADLDGQVLARIEVKEYKEEDDEWGDCHEMAFVEIGTDKESITIVSHVEHNGYYGGFALTLTEE